MKHIDRLIIKARKQVNLKAERLIQAFMYGDDVKGVYIVDCRLWNGIKGSGTRQILSGHQTEDEAWNQLDKIADEYPNDKDVVIFFNENALED